MQTTKTEMETKRNRKKTDTRKIRKPLMEKKRRARINDSLETLKQILLDATTIKRTDCSVDQRLAKLEKADVLEMTVRYLQRMRVHEKFPDVTMDDQFCQLKQFRKREKRACAKRTCQRAFDLNEKITCGKNVRVNQGNGQCNMFDSKNMSLETVFIRNGEYFLTNNWSISPDKPIWRPFL